MLLRRDVPAWYDEWNRRWGAPHGRPLARKLPRKLRSLPGVAQWVGPFGFQPNSDTRAPTRRIDIHLTGNMERFMWSMDGEKLSENPQPFRFARNERVRLRLINDTMMTHPMHLHGHHALVPWAWTAIVLNATAAVLLVFSGVRRHLVRVEIACVLALVGVWIEKGMGLIIPAFVPSTLHEIVEYVPNAIEWKVTAGIWAFGLMVYTIGAKLSVAVYTGEERLHRPAPSRREQPREHTP